MNSPLFLDGNPKVRRATSILFAVLVLCWVPFVYAHIYCLGFANMDSWTLTAPAAMAKAPLALTTPFLGTFDGANKAWGLHWPGGPLLASIFTPFLPHNAATYVALSVCYWLMQSLAAAALVRRLTASPWMSLCAFLFVAGDHTCFNVAWLERYENLGGAIAIAGILALRGRPEHPTTPRAALVAAAAFFMLPLIHPVFSGLGGGWIVYLGLRTIALRQPWKQFLVAAGGYAAGWAAFLAYFWSRPWLYAQFRNHAQQNVEITRAGAPPGIVTFLHHLMVIDSPTHGGTLIYLVAFGGVIYLGWAFLRSGPQWQTFLVREDLSILAALGLLGTLFLVQFSYNFIAYWGAPWPFAAAIACLAAQRLMDAFPGCRRLVVGGLVVLLLLHGAYLPARTYMWYKTGIAEVRAPLRKFASTLPQHAQLFVPEVLWDTYADGSRDVLMNSLPYSAGIETQQRYASYMASRMHSGDVLVIDQLQSHATLIDPTQPGWKAIGTCKLVYQGPGGNHGYDMTAYQKQ
jgi:hypothetical protein